MTLLNERQQAAMGTGAFSNIEKTHWQPLTRDVVYNPALQQIIVSGSKGAFVGMAGIGASVALAFVAPSACVPVAGFSVFAGVLTMLYEFQRDIGDTFETSRRQELSRELYQKEQRAAASASNETITLEHRYYDKSGTYRRTDFDELPTNKEDLARLWQAYQAGDVRLSKTGVRAALVCGDKRAGDVLNAMEMAGYIRYDGKRTSPQGATFTHKGESVCTAFLEKLTYLLELTPENAQSVSE